MLLFNFSAVHGTCILLDRLHKLFEIPKIYVTSDGGEGGSKNTLKRDSDDCLDFVCINFFCGHQSSTFEEQKRSFLGWQRQLLIQTLLMLPRKNPTLGKNWKKT